MTDENDLPASKVAQPESDRPRDTEYVVKMMDLDSLETWLHRVTAYSRRDAIYIAEGETTENQVATGSVFEEVAAESESEEE